MVVLLVKVPESANTGAAFPHLLPFPVYTHIQPMQPKMYIYWTWRSSCWQQHLTHPNLALCTMTNKYKHHCNPNYPFHDEKYQSSCANYCVIGNLYSASSIIILVHSLPELPPAHSGSNYQTRDQTPPNTLPSIRNVLDLRSAAQDIYVRNKGRRE